MFNKYVKKLAVVTGLSLVLIGNIYGANVEWIDWEAAKNGSPGSAIGTIYPSSGIVFVDYTGEVKFAQTSEGKIDYWKPSSAY